MTPLSWQIVILAATLWTEGVLLAWGEMRRRERMAVVRRRLAR